MKVRGLTHSKIYSSTNELINIDQDIHVPQHIEDISCFCEKCDNNDCITGNILVRPSSLETACYIVEHICQTYKVYINNITKYLSCDVILPRDVRYFEARLLYNKLYSLWPACIVLVRNTSDVSDTIKYCLNNKLPFRIRSGGHSNAPVSIKNYAVIIDTSKMNKIVSTNVSHCSNIGTAIVQVGALLGPTINSLTEIGYILPTGTCATNGIGGVSLAGGFGQFSRYFGLTIDNLLEITIVDSEGYVHNVTEKDSKIFNAIRGAGAGNFGVVTEYKFQIYKILEAQTYQFDFPYSSLESVFTWFDTDGQKLDDKIGLDMNILSKGLPFTISGVASVFNDLNLDFKSLLDLGLHTSFESQKENINKVAQWISSGSYARPLCGFAQIFFTEKLFGTEGVTKIQEALSKTLPDNIFDSVSILLLGGEVSRIKSDDTGFPWRKALYWCEISTRFVNQNDAKASIEWVRKSRDSFKDIVGITIDNENIIPSYSGFIDLDMDVTTAQKSYWGNNIQWLREVKTEVDPRDVFNWQYSIKPY